MPFEQPPRGSANRVERLPKRAAYDEESVYHAIDRASICHATFRLQETDNTDEWPTIIPMIYGRKDATIYLHGHLSSRLLKALSGDGDVRACLAFTTVTGIVAAISPFHSSNNYESAVLYGYTRLISDDKEKVDALTRITNHQFRSRDGTEGNRWGLARETSETELNSTRVIAFDIEMASVKKRQEGVHDDKEDIDGYSDKIWSGVIHKREIFYEAEAMPYNKAPLPDYVTNMMS